MTQIEAQKMLNDFQVAMFPELKNEARRKLHKDMTRKAYPDRFENENKPLTLDQVLKRVEGR